MLKDEYIVNQYIYFVRTTQWIIRNLVTIILDLHWG